MKSPVCWCSQCLDTILMHLYQCDNVWLFWRQRKESFIKHRCLKLRHRITSNVWKRKGSIAVANKMAYRHSYFWLLKYYWPNVKKPVHQVSQSYFKGIFPYLLHFFSDWSFFSHDCQTECKDGPSIFPSVISRMRLVIWLDQPHLTFMNINFRRFPSLSCHVGLYETIGYFSLPLNVIIRIIGHDF